MHFKVIVIGAGLAGLSAVGRLNELGVTSFLVLEARKDIGGRVRMIDFAGTQFNIGPEWLHGQKSNPIYDLVTTKLKLQTLNCDDYTYFFNKPVLWTVKERENLFRSKLNYLQEIVDTRIMAHNINSLQRKSISDILGLDTDNDPFHDFAKYWAFNYENGTSASEYSALVYRLSSKIFENVPAFSDYYFTERNGFSKLVEHYRKEASFISENLSLGDPVSTICSQNNAVHIVTEKGKHYSSDYCIFAAPISVLANDGISIYPRLHCDVRNAMAKIPFSSYTRVFVELHRDMVIPDFDWFVDMDSNCNEDTALWQNTRNYRPTLIAHVSHSNTEATLTNLEDNVKRSLGNIFGKQLKSIINMSVVSLKKCRFSFGAFPCATADFTINDARVIEGLGDNSRLQFAGDSYDLEYFGTVQGAVASGRRAADRTFDFMSNDVLSHRRAVNK